MNSIIRKTLVFALLVALSSPPTIISQEKVRGKAVVSGIWNGKAVKYAAGGLAIKVKRGYKAADLASTFGKFHSRIKQDFDDLGWGWVEFADSVDVMSVISDLQKNGAVEAAEPNFIGKVHVLPNDPYFNGTSPATYPHQWALRNTGQTPPEGTSGADIDATDAWNLTTGSSNVLMGVLDSGIPILNGTLSHADLDDQNRIIIGRDFVETLPADTTVRDLLGHGTHVAGIAGGETNNNTGIAGIAWNCKILVVQAFDAGGYSIPQAFYNAVRYAVDYARNNNYKLVINFSGGWNTTSGPLQDAVAYADSYNVVIVASAGNNYGGSVQWPASYSSSYSNVIAVSATDQNDVVSSYSNIGPQINVSAPGGWGGYQDGSVWKYNGANNLGRNIFSTEPNYAFNLQAGTDCTEDYGYLAGTSMAAPQVSGTVALLLSTRPSLTPAQIRNTMELSADDKGATGKDDYYGYGRLNANAAVRNLYVPQVYSTVASAVSAAIGGQTVVVSSGSHSITSNLTVPSGVTLQLNSGASLSLSSGVTFTVNGTLVAYSSLTIPMGRTMNVGEGGLLKFGPGVSLVANGQLRANGSSDHHIIFTSTGGTSPQSWGSISMNGNAASGSSMNYADVNYGTKIEVTNATGVTIQNCTLTRMGYGIDFEGTSSNYCSVLNNRIYMPDFSRGILVGTGANVTVSGNIIKEINENKNGNAIHFLSAGGYVGRNDVAYCNSGILATWGSSPYAYSPYSLMRNNRVTHCNYGLVAYELSYPVFGTSPPSDYMWNSIHDNYKNASVGSSTYASTALLAQGNWWGGPPNSSMFVVFPGAYFSYTPYLTSDPWAGIPLPSVRSDPGEDAGTMPVMASMNTVGSAGNYAQPKLTGDLGQPGPMDSLLAGINMLVQRKNKEASVFFFDYLKKNPDNQAAYAFLYNAADGETTPVITRFFESLPPQAAEGHRLLLPYLYLKAGDIASAKRVNNEIISQNSKTVLAARAQLNNFYIALYDENDPDGASVILDDVVKGNTLSTSNELAAARTALATYVDPKTGKMPYSGLMTEADGQSDEVAAQLPEEGGMIQNYPNPFNPTTTISYRLPKSGKVELKVYDILGREVVTLVSGYREAGVHTAYFNAQNLASGVYFYRLTAPGISQVKKMLMTK